MPSAGERSTEPRREPSRPARRRVVVIDDDDVVRAGVSALIETSGRLEVERCASTAAALGALERDPADLVVVDSHLDHGHGLDLVTELRRRAPDTAIALIVHDDGRDRAVHGLDELVDAVVPVGVSGAALVSAVEELAVEHHLRSQVLVHAPQPARWADERWREARLTPQEQRVLALITDSMTNREIAAELGVGEATVKNYVRSLLAKLGFERRTQAVVYGVHRRARGWSPPPLEGVP